MAGGHRVAFRANPGAEAAVPALAGLPRDDGAPADVLVLDHYDLGWREERALAAETGARLTVAIDDLADRVHDCGLLVDAARDAGAYRGLVPAGVELLTGPAHALLRPAFAALRPASLARRRGVSAPCRAVVAFGLSDATPAVAAALDALERALPEAEVEVIVGPAGAAGAEALIRGRARLLVAPPDYAERLARADLAIGAAGGAALERCALGVPSVVLPIADNQAASAAALARAGAALVVPEEARGRPVPALADLLGSIGAGLPDLSVRAAAYCDGGGAGRVAAAILRRLGAPPPPPAADPLVLREAVPGDARMLWAWRNDRDTRAASRDTAVVAWEAHWAWLAARLAAPAETRLFVAERGAEPVGTLRLERRGVEAEISLTVAPLHRGGGQGRALLDCRSRPRAEARAGVLGDRAPRQRRLAAAVRGLGIPHGWRRTVAALHSPGRCGWGA